MIINTLAYSFYPRGHLVYIKSKKLIISVGYTALLEQPARVNLYVEMRRKIWIFSPSKEKIYFSKEKRL